MNKKKAEAQIKLTDVKVEDFIESFAEIDKKKKDAYGLLNIISETTGYKPKI